VVFPLAGAGLGANGRICGVCLSLLAAVKMAILDTVACDRPPPMRSARMVGHRDYFVGFVGVWVSHCSCGGYWPSPGLGSGALYSLLSKPARGLNSGRSYLTLAGHVAQVAFIGR